MIVELPANFLLPVLLRLRQLEATARLEGTEILDSDLADALAAKPAVWGRRLLHGMRGDN